MTARWSLPASPVVECRAGLSLRRHRDDDFQPVVEMGQDAEMQRWTVVPVPYRPADAEEFLTGVRDRWEAGTVAAFAIDLDGRFAGNLDLRWEEGAWAEVGYATAPWARGRGVMSAALRSALKWGFDALRLDGVHWQAQVGNHASRRVAEKCGFRIEGTGRALLVQRGRRFDGWIGSIVASELPTS